MSNDMYKILANGVKMPSIGFGTYKLIDKVETVNCIKEAIKIGYRQIDAAYFYKNEDIVRVDKAFEIVVGKHHD